MDSISQRNLFLKHVAQTSDMPMMGIDINIQHADGVKLIDVNGKEYLDLISGISVSNLGHCNPEVTKAITEQVKKFTHLMVYGEFNQSPQVAYAQKLSTLLPNSLNCIYFTTGGSEAIEGAMKLAKRYTGRSEFVSFTNSYHGSTQGALSLMGNEQFKNAFRPLLPGIKHLPFNQTEELESINENIAAVFVEPVQAEAGVIPATGVFMKALRKRCSETGTLLVFDEIQTGFGRSGKLFAFEKLGVIPDILCIAKGMGGGIPIGGFVASKEIMAVLTHNPVLGHINTFGGNALSASAALAALNVIVENKLWEKAAEIENILKKNLTHPQIKKLNSVGAMAAIHLENEEKNFTVCKKLLEKGIITDWFLFCSHALRLAPPLIITKEELEKACRLIIDTLDEI